MAITAKKGEGFERELIPAGNYVARCYKMVEIGTIPGEYMGKPKMTHKVRISWELPLETRVFKEENGEQPMVIDKQYTLSLADGAHLRSDLKSWRGKDFTTAEAEAFDITKLIGVPCMLNIIHKPSKDGSKTYQEIAGITPLPKGFECPPAVNPTFVFELENFSQEKFDTLPQFIKDDIVKSEEYKSLSNPHPDAMEVNNISQQEEPDDLPF